MRHKHLSSKMDAWLNEATTQPKLYKLQHSLQACVIGLEAKIKNLPANTFTCYKRSVLRRQCRDTDWNIKRLAYCSYG